MEPFLPHVPLDFDSGVPQQLGGWGKDGEILEAIQTVQLRNLPKEFRFGILKASGTEDRGLEGFKAVISSRKKQLAEPARSYESMIGLL